MNKQKVIPGNSYWTKVGQNWQLVTVLRFGLSLSGNDVVVRTLAGNQIYRDVRQLHLTHKGSK